jgi:hypothetical protein
MGHLGWVFVGGVWVSPKKRPVASCQRKQIEETLMDQRYGVSILVKVLSYLPEHTIES